ncbi:RagB/SusD family nutrient uptake outer membrane protein [Flavimarina sp. Hel_I_48]|uniref:RagB/SusD family nutrient uptake outer membrane protein n=1 Tax=Flavimarina sp. Hel_I_48 TaxID=1392488 RepID=UPI0004DF5B0D|nr:RagB/SusD family nutrient uptake outer membrane protein [Flavimarina sp. Hel_I_48]
MKNNTRTYIGLLLFTIVSLISCTNLEEELYDRVTSENFIQTKEDVYRTFLRSFEHGYWTVQGDQYDMQENTGDQLMTATRGADWFDGGKYIRLHNHEWNTDDGFVEGGWKNLYTGIVLATNSLEDIQALDPSSVKMSEEERSELVSELRILRAWYYLRLFDFYRNIQLITAVKGETEAVAQSTPKETFDFIENEILESVPALFAKGDPGTENFDGRWTKAAAMTLLSRLYLNAEVYIGEAKYEQCATITQDIVDGKYGSYGIEERWDAPFDYDNNSSKETLFAFPGSFTRTHWHYSSGMFWWQFPANINLYFNFTAFGNSNPKYALQPGKDLEGNEYAFPLGKPFVKFEKYPDDVRLIKYKNTGLSSREGMFLYGYLPYNDGSEVLMSKDGSYKLYLRDQVGQFNDLEPEQELQGASTMLTADENSGVRLVKYPFYSDDSPNRIEPDFVEMRLAEVYYTLAECRFREGNLAEAANLLNLVRSRYYPEGSQSLYEAGELNEVELLDAWGSEFLGEGRRRIDLIRFGKFTTGAWWDKESDGGDDHLEVFPLSENTLNVNPQLVQNPGY